MTEKGGGDAGFIEWFNQKYGLKVKEGDFVCCVNASHKDDTPSMKVYRDNAKCYGCGCVVSFDNVSKKSVKQLFNEELVSLCKKEYPEEWNRKRKYNKEIIKELSIGLLTTLVYNELIDLFGDPYLKRIKFLDTSSRKKFLNWVIIPYSDSYYAMRNPDRNAKIKNKFPEGSAKGYLVLPGKKETILCEGETDAIALRHLYPENKIISMGGVQSVVKFCKGIEDFGVSEEVWICFDNDDIGEEFAFKAQQALFDKGFDVRKLSFDSEFKDIDDVYVNFREDARDKVSVVDLKHKQVFVDKNFVPISKEDYRKVIEFNFPHLWPVVDVCVSNLCLLKLKSWTDPVGINLVGQPSGEKTTALSFFYGIESLVHKSDSFTAKSFVSHSSSVSKEELEDVDLLPKIKDKCFIIPELAPTFSKRREDLVDTIGVITRVFDGEGLESDSGSQGHRGYVGEYLFTWLGATTPLEPRVWKVMGKMGTRWFFLNVPEHEKGVDELKLIINGNKDYKRKLSDCREATDCFLKSVFRDGMKRNIEWDDTKNCDVSAGVIVACAQLLKKMRAVVDFFEDREGFKYNIPLVEKPYRIINILKNLAKGHAISEGRDMITVDDLCVVVNVALSSMPYDRLKLLQFLIDSLEKNDFLDSKVVAEAIHCSERHARMVLKQLAILKVLEEVVTGVEDLKGRPMNKYRLLPEIVKDLNVILPYYTLGKSLEFGYDAEDKNRKVVFLKGFRQCVGTDELEYGPFSAGDKVELPEDMARALASNNQVKLL